MTTRYGDYLIDGRLEDVIALIQVLGLDKHAHRSEGGLNGELQGPPMSADEWTKVASRHPEFFRVAEKGEHPISLVCRHVSDKSTTGREVTVEFIQQLLHTAVTIHDCQVKRSQRWSLYLPIWGAFITGLLAIFAAAISLFSKGAPGAGG